MVETKSFLRAGHFACLNTVNLPILGGRYYPQSHFASEETKAKKRVSGFPKVERAKDTDQQ